MRPARRDRRLNMVTTQLVARGISDRRVLEAMARVPREAFLPEYLAPYAYDDAPLPIGGGQTISQPYIVAFMIEALEPLPSDRVLDVGTGSGYAAAVLALVVRHVFSIERKADLAAQAQERLARLGYSNVEVKHGDGSLGWPEHAPYDGIVAAAGAPEVPAPLVHQLAAGGRLVMPIGETPEHQVLVRLRRRDEERIERQTLGDVRFVPLVGAEGWDGNTASGSP